MLKHFINKMLNKHFIELVDQSYLIKKAIKQFCNNKIVLDMGCGDLKYSIEAKKAGAKRVIALDIKKPKKMIKEIKFIQGNAERTSFKANYFDVVIAVGIIEYIDLEKGVSEIKRVLKPGGLVVFATKDSRGICQVLYKKYCKVKGKLPKGMPHNYNKLYSTIKDNFKIIEKKITKPKHFLFFILQK